jgi:MFS-type transporter involved in bile tolerance (Atg22 family)
LVLATLVLAALLTGLAALLAGLLSRLLLPATLLLTGLAWLRIALLLLVAVRILVLLIHGLLLGGFSARPETICRRRRPFRVGTRVI